MTPEPRATATGTRSATRLERLTAGLVRGPVEVLDFLLPLWAGQQLGLSPAAVGLLVAAETIVSFLARPLAGSLADRLPRRPVAAVGALLYGASFVGYALADSFAAAVVAAVVGGVGGALFWIALRAALGEALAADGAAFSRLFAAEGAGTWVAFVVALTLIAQIDYRGVFLTAAAACAAGAAVLVYAQSAARPPAVPGGRTPVFAALGRRLLPLLAVVVVVAVVETGVALLLLLHLQRGFGLDVGAVAAVFLPGFIVYTVLPEYLHGVVVRLGRARVVTLALVAGAAFAVVLSFAPSPWVIAVAWILSAASFAAVIPVEQSVVAEAAGVDLGRGMALYESATLLGATVGAVAAGVLYGSGSGWQIACVGAGAVLLVAAAAAPAALRASGSADRPEPAAGPAPEVGERPTDPPAADRDDARTGPAAEPGPDDPDDPARDGSVPVWGFWAVHAAIYVVAQIVLAVLGTSWPVAAVVDGPHPPEWFWNSSGDRVLDIGRIWTAVFLLDCAWTAAKVIHLRVRPPRPETDRASPR